MSEHDDDFQNGQSTFSVEDIARMNKNKLFEGSEEEPKTIGVFVDPINDGSGLSEMTIVSVCLINGAIVVVGMESHPVKHFMEMNQIFRAHIEGLRRHEWTCKSRIVLFCERNTGHESGHFAAVLNGFHNTACFIRPCGTNGQIVACSHMRPGFVTTLADKNKYRTDLNDALSSDRILFLRSWVSTKNDHKEKLVSQLSRCKDFSKSVSPPLKFFTWSGKAHNYSDDLAVTFAAAVSIFSQFNLR
jgi:hypothetical protein